MLLPVFTLSLIGIAYAIPLYASNQYYIQSSQQQQQQVQQQLPSPSLRNPLTPRYTYPIFDIHANAPLTEKINSYNTELYRAATVGARVGQLENRYLQNVDYRNNFPQENDQLGVNISPGVPALLYSSVAPPGVQYIYGYDNENGVQLQGSQDGDAPGVVGLVGLNQVSGGILNPYPSHAGNRFRKGYFNYPYYQY